MHHYAVCRHRIAISNPFEAAVWKVSGSMIGQHLLVALVPTSKYGVEDSLNCNST